MSASGDPTAWAELLAAFCADGDVKSAWRALELWEKLEPESAQPKLYRAALLYAQGDLHQAIKAVDEFLSEDPESTKALMLKHMIQLRLGDAEAHATFSKALATCRSQEELWLELGELQSYIGDVDGAARSYRKAVAVNPGNVAGWEGLGMAYARAGRYDAAEAAFKKAQEIAEDPRGVYKAALWELIRGNTQEALKVFEFNRERRDKSPSYWLNYGLARLLAKDYDGAKSCFEKVLELNPHFAYAHYNLACLYARLADFERATRHLLASFGFDRFKVAARTDGDIAPLLAHPQFGEVIRRSLSDR